MKNFRAEQDGLVFILEYKRSDAEDPDVGDSRGVPLGYSVGALELVAKMELDDACFFDPTDGESAEDLKEAAGHLARLWLLNEIGFEQEDCKGIWITICGMEIHIYCPVRPGRSPLCRREGIRLPDRGDRPRRRRRRDRPVRDRDPEIPARPHGEGQGAASPERAARRGIPEGCRGKAQALPPRPRVDLPPDRRSRSAEISRRPDRAQYGGSRGLGGRGHRTTRSMRCRRKRPRRLPYRPSPRRIGDGA